METKKRRDSYFGLHFDFHSRGTAPVGDRLRYDVVAKLLDEVKPDYVQIDTKGHPGWSSYPTKSGNPAPDMRGDQVRMWRELTAERGIALYGHHSGLFDFKAMADHPEWAVVDENRVVSDRTPSVFGPYADELLIPQLLELALDYRLDGAWVDGECWGTKLDYSPHAAKAFGGRPPKPGEEGFRDYLEFCREGFKDYVRHYIAAVKAKAPGFQITSNWMYSAYMPEKPDVPIDFISGDYSPNNSVDSARVNGRFISNQGLPWDLMAWGHNSEGSWTTVNRSTKELVQHCQEAAYIISLGGGFQFYNIQYHEGATVQEWAIPVWKKTAEFVRERERFCHGAEHFHQVGVFLSTAAHRAGISTLYAQGSPAMVSAKGLIHLAQDSGYSSELLSTHNLFDRDLSEYGAIIVGRAETVEPEAKEALLKYAEGGGGLLLASAESAKLFGFESGTAENRLLHISDGEALAPVLTSAGRFESDIAGEINGCSYNDNYMGDGPYPAAVFRRYVKGGIIALSFDIGGAYPQNRTTCIRNFFRSQLGRLFPRPAVTVEGSDYVDLSLMKKDGKLYIHLLNYAGPHNSPGHRSYNDIPALGPLTVRINTTKAPRSVYIEPEHARWEGDAHCVTIARLKIHTILEVEFDG